MKLTKVSFFESITPENFFGISILHEADADCRF
jgi:hypothetical protein